MAKGRAQHGAAEMVLEADIHGKGREWKQLDFGQWDNSEYFQGTRQYSLTPIWPE